MSLLIPFTCVAALFPILPSPAQAATHAGPPASPSPAFTVTAKVYDLDGDLAQPLFTLDRKERVEEGKRVVTFSFKDSKGQSALEEKVVYKSASSWDFESYVFDRIQNKEYATVTAGTDGKLRFVLKKDDKEAKDRKEKLESNTIIRDTLIPFVHQHWAELMKGDSVKARFALPDRAETIGFRITKMDDANEVINGVPAYKLKLRPSAFAIGLIAGNTWFWVEKEGEHRILRADGRVPLMKEVNGTLKNINGRLDFTYTPVSASASNPKTQAAN